MNTLARRLGCTEGQAYTAIIGLALAFGLLLVGLPPVLRDEQPGATPMADGRQHAAAAPGAVAVTGAAVAPSVGLPGPSPVQPAPPQPSSPPGPRAGPEPAGPNSGSVALPPSVTARPMPRSIVDSGYTSSTSGTALSGPEVPDDGMPVGVRLGSVDKMSFLRLVGTHPVLHLRLVDDPAANQLVALAAVQACVITEHGWVLDRPGASPEDAPAFDARRCTDGEAAPDGTWQFDLEPLGGVADDAGIALLPVSEGPASFQVTFSDVALPPAAG